MNPAYLAGVTDSDGSLSIARKIRPSGRIHYNPIYQLTWTDTPFSRKVFDSLVKKYGGSYARCMPSNTKGYPNTRPVVKYHISGVKIAPLIDSILPFLMLKRKQARTIQRFLKTYAVGGFSRWKLKPQRLVDFETKMYEYNKTLNTKNGTIK